MDREVIGFSNRYRIFFDLVCFFDGTSQGSGGHGFLPNAWGRSETRVYMSFFRVCLVIL
jgi:hypothetical protein